MRPSPLWLLVLLLARATTSSAQTQPLSQEEAGGLANYAFTNEVGFGGYDVGGQRVRAIRIPIVYLLRSPVDHRVGMRLRFPLTFGTYSLTIVDFLDDLNLRTFSFVPGIEFLIPFGERWMLMPRQDLGFTKDFEGGDLALISATAVRGMYIHEFNPVELSLGSGLKYSFSRTSNGLNNDDFALVEAGADLRFPLGFSVKGHKVDSSVYFIGRHYFRTLVFGQVEEEPIELERLYEVGLTFGTTPRPVVFGIRIPRIGVGYLFGDNLKGIKINFGFPFRPGPRQRS